MAALESILPDQVKICGTEIILLYIINFGDAITGICSDGLPAANGQRLIFSDMHFALFTGKIRHLNHVTNCY